MLFAVEVLTGLDEPARFEILLLFYGMLKSEADRVEALYHKYLNAEMLHAFKKILSDTQAIFMELMKYAPGFVNDVPGQTRS